MTVQSITAAAVPKFTWSNGAFIGFGAAEPIQLGKDRLTFFGQAGQTLYQSTNFDTAADGAATWSAITTFPNTLGQIPCGLLELADGEVLVATAELNTTPNKGRVYRSTGWGASLAARQAATWTETLVTIGGRIGAQYSFNYNTIGNNGVVLICEQGTQTAGGAGNVTADLSKARRLWVSVDFGKTFTLIWDVVTFGQSQGVAYPANVHPHGSLYDEIDDRIYQCYGDATGDGKNIAGAGYVQVVYSDDWREKIAAGQSPTWVKLPTPQYFDNTGKLGQTLQFITGASLANGIVFTPDTLAPLYPLVYGRAGYRQLSQPRAGAPLAGYGGGILLPDGTTSAIYGGGGIGGCPCCASGKPDGVRPTFFGGQQNPMPSNAPGRAYLAVSADFLNWSRLTLDTPAQTGNPTVYGFSQCFGPTVNGKVVAYSGQLSLFGGVIPGPYINNDTTKRVYRADLTGPA